MVYSVALNNCRNFAGYNRRYGYQSVRHYSVQDVATSLLINKLKSSVFVPGFLPWELDTLLHQACTRLYVFVSLHVCTLFGPKKCMANASQSNQGDIAHVGVGGLVPMLSHTPFS